MINAHITLEDIDEYPYLHFTKKINGQIYTTVKVALDVIDKKNCKLLERSITGLLLSLERVPNE